MRSDNIFKNIFSILGLFCFFSVACKSEKAMLEAVKGEASVTDSILHMVISKGGDAGEYQAFPDAYRLQNGNILIVFYTGKNHITYVDDKGYPKAGRICMVRSSDEGKTWSEPQTIYDSEHDDRDPHITQLKDGTVVVNFFSRSFFKNGRRTDAAVQLMKSHDNGRTWSTESQKIDVRGLPYYTSGKLKELPDGTILFPVYYSQSLGKEKKAWGGILRSHDQGLSWSEIISIGKEANLFLPAETVVIELEGGTLLAALRGGHKIPMHYAKSMDEGETWEKVESFGFQGHAPSFTRLNSGRILLTYRGIDEETDGSWTKAGYTALRVSNDEGNTWQGPYLIDKTSGAYPSTVELKDGTVLAVYYEEGAKSGIRVKRFRTPQDINKSEFSEPQPVQAISF